MDYVTHIVGDSIFDVHSKENCGQVDYTCEIHNLGNALENAWIREMNMEGSDGFLLVFSLNDVSTFDALDGFVREICGDAEKSYEHAPIILVGTESEKETKVMDAGIKEFLKRTFHTTEGGVLEVSVQTGDEDNVHSPFKTILTQASKRRPKLSCAATRGYDFYKQKVEETIALYPQKTPEGMKDVYKVCGQAKMFLNSEAKLGINNAANKAKITEICSDFFKRT